MNRVRVGRNLTSLDFAGGWIPLRDVTGSNVYDGAEVVVDRRYAGVGNRIVWPGTLFVS